MLNPHDVADYLINSPDFFEQNADLLASLNIPHPQGGRAIPLLERQMIALREKNKALEWRLSELIRYGKENEEVADKLHHWTRALLLQRNARMLPDALTYSLATIFSVPHVALRVWEATDDFADLHCTQPVSVDLIHLINRSQQAYCGEINQDHQVALQLLDAPVQSIALIPLRREPASDTPAEAFGLLLLASQDPRRFHANMGIEFLIRIGATASAALSRLLN